MICFNCKQEGHMSRDCDWVPGAGPAWTITHRPADPPSATYLEAKAGLGLAANPDAAALLSVTCPWCLSGPWQHCVNRALGTVKQRAHDARYEAAGIEPPRRPALADVARRQVDEAREHQAKLTGNSPG